MSNYFQGSESEEQQALFQWAEVMSRHYPKLSLLYHIPNGGARSKGTAGRLKAEGVKSGVPDICLPVSNGKYHGLYVEMKIKGNKPSPNQVKWIESLNEEGYKAVVCYGWQEAAKAIQDYIECKDQ